MIVPLRSRGFRCGRWPSCRRRSRFDRGTADPPACSGSSAPTVVTMAGSLLRSPQKNNRGLPVFRSYAYGKQRRLGTRSAASDDGDEDEDMSHGDGLGHVGRMATTSLVVVPSCAFCGRLRTRFGANSPFSRVSRRLRPGEPRTPREAQPYADLAIALAGEPALGDQLLDVPHQRCVVVGPHGAGPAPRQRSCLAI